MITLFEQILNDEEVIRLYKLVEDSESEENYATHGFCHVTNVVDMSERVARMLGLSEKEIEEVKIAALLHDIGIATGEHPYEKKGHAERSYIWVRDYLEDKNMTYGSLKQILDAIRHHGKGIDSCYSRILTFADKLDINKDRITSTGLKIKGNRQYANLISVDFEIKEGTLCVKFISNGQIDWEELNSYYFTPKVLQVIKRLALYFSLDHRVSIDNVSWVC